VSKAYKLGKTSVILRVFLPDSASTVGAGKTALDHTAAGLIISTIAENEASSTTYTSAGSTVEAVTTLGTFAAPTATKCRFKKVDDTNHPGIYEIQIADARWAVTSARSLFITIQATGVAQTMVEVQFDADANVSSVSASAITAAAFAPDGTAQAGASGTITLASGESATNDIHKYKLISIVSGTGTGQCALVTAYNGTTKIATIYCLQGTSGAWATTPDSTSTYVFSAWIDPLRTVIETQGSYTAQQVLSILFAASSGEWTSAGVFKSPNGSATRISGTAASAAPFRSSITLTPSS
jgi:hypothetical protein